MANAKKLPSGSWRVLLFDGKDENGKRIYKSFTAETKKEAEYLAMEYATGRKKSNDELKTMTVGTMIDKYIASKENILSPTTIASYKEIRRNRLQCLMDIPINHLTQLDIQNAINLEAKTKSPKTVISAHGLLSSALKMFLPNFRLNTTLPRKKKTIRTLIEPKKIIDIVKNTEIEIPTLLALFLGLRMSEIRGLKWQCIQNGYITIENVIVTVDGKAIEKKDTKSVAGVRVLKLPKYLNTLIENERASSDSEYITTLSGQAIYKRFSRLLEKNDLPHMRFHDLRHLNASIMLQLGVQDKYAMERGGWSTLSTMKDVYQHTLSAEREKVDNIVNTYFDNLCIKNK